MNIPDATTDLPTWLDYLLAIHPTEIDMGLTRVTAVAERLSVTSLEKTKLITVAGTNGKGSTCALIESILRLAGHTVGVYSSPHLVKYNERFRINGKDVADSELINAFTLIEKARLKISLTFFEYATVAGLLLFKQAKLDFVILEVGLGGRLDATNLIDSDLSVITAIDLDHESYLGNTRSAIGIEKAGIFRENREAIIGEPDLPQTVFDFAAQTHTPLYCVNSQHGHQGFHYKISSKSWEYFGTKRHIINIPKPQLPLCNAATAIAVIEKLVPELDEKFICQAIGETRLAGRLECVGEQPLVLLDVGHNPHAAKYLASQLHHYKPRKIIALWGMLKDKDLQGVADALSNVIDSWYLISLHNERGATSAQLAETLVKETNKFQFETMQEAWSILKCQAQPDDVIIIFGSFYTVAAFKSQVEAEGFNV